MPMLMITLTILINIAMLLITRVVHYRHYIGISVFNASDVTILTNLNFVCPL